MASKIEDSMSPAEVVELLLALAETEGGEKLRIIRDEAQKRGVQVSLMGATTFRDNQLKPFLEKLKFAKEKSSALAAVMEGGGEEGLLASARTRLAEEMSDFLMADGPVSKKDFVSLAKALSALSASNQGDRALRMRIAQYEAQEKERQEAAARLEEKKKKMLEKGGLSEEAIALMEETLKILS